MEKKTQEVFFNFFDLHFTPYNDQKGFSSNTILKESLKCINDERTNNKNAILINRTKDQANALPRNLFMVSAAYSHPDKKWKCKMGLLREGRVPSLVNKETYSLTSLEVIGNHAWAEITSFCIDTNGDYPVVCCEYNYHGPRISDIEFYLRHVSFDILRISKKCKAAIHMKMPIKQVLDSIAEVLKFEVKAKPNKIKYLQQDVDHAFVTNMNGLASTVEPDYLRVEASFRKRDPKIPNPRPLNFVKKVLTALKDDDGLVEDFGDFYLEFLRNDGTEDVFNLLSGKQEVSIVCNESSPGIPDSKELGQKVVIKFDEYLIQMRS